MEVLSDVSTSPQMAPVVFPESPAGDTGAPKAVLPRAETPRAETGASAAPRADTGATDLPAQQTPTSSSFVQPMAMMADTGACPPVAETGSSPSTALIETPSLPSFQVKLQSQPETGDAPSNALPLVPQPEPRPQPVPLQPHQEFLETKSPSPSPKKKSPRRARTSPLGNLISREGSALFAGIKYQKCNLEKGRILTYMEGEDGLKHVVSYSHDALVNWGGLPGIFINASVFRLRSSLLKQLLVLSVIAVCSCLLLTAIMAANPPPGGDGRLLHEMRRRLQDDGGGDGDGDGDGDEEENQQGENGKIDPKLWWLNQVLPLIELAGFANTLVTFLLGVFVSVSISRWWTLRSGHLQKILAATRHLIFSLASILPEDKYKSVRQQMARHAMLSFRLLFLSARSSAHHVAKILGRSELEILQIEGLLTAEEKEEMLEGIAFSSHHLPKGSFDGDLAEIPWLWNCRAIHILFKAGAYPPPVLAMLHRLCLDARNGIDGVFTQMNAQLPFAYCHLITMLVQFSVFLSAVKCGLMIALSDTWVSLVCEAGFSCGMCTVYLGLLALSAVIADPFGDDLIDFPAAQMFDQLWQGCSVLDCLLKPPECYGKDNRTASEMVQGAAAAALAISGRHLGVSAIAKAAASSSSQSASSGGAKVASGGDKETNDAKGVAAAAAAAFQRSSSAEAFADLRIRGDPSDVLT